MTDYRDCKNSHPFLFVGYKDLPQRHFVHLMNIGTLGGSDLGRVRFCRVEDLIEHIPTLDCSVIEFTIHQNQHELAEYYMMLANGIVANRTIQSVIIEFVGKSPAANGLLKRLMRGRVFSAIRVSQQYMFENNDHKSKSRNHVAEVLAECLRDNFGPEWLQLHSLVTAKAPDVDFMDALKHNTRVKQFDAPHFKLNMRALHELFCVNSTLEMLGIPNINSLPHESFVVDHDKYVTVLRELNVNGYMSGRNDAMTITKLIPPSIQDLKIMNIDMVSLDPCFPLLELFVLDNIQRLHLEYLEMPHAVVDLLFTYVAHSKSLVHLVATHINTWTTGWIELGLLPQIIDVLLLNTTLEYMMLTEKFFINPKTIARDLTPAIAQTTTLQSFIIQTSVTVNDLSPYFRRNRSLYTTLIPHCERYGFLTEEPKKRTMHSLAERPSFNFKRFKSR